MEAIRSAVAGANADLYRHLALYLQVLRSVLQQQVDRACFHLVTREYGGRYLRLGEQERLELHQRLRLLVERCSSLLTVEQLAALAGQMRKQRRQRLQKQHRDLVRRLLRGEDILQPEDSEASPAQSPEEGLPASADPLPPGSVRLQMVPPLGEAGLQWSFQPLLPLESAPQDGAVTEADDDPAFTDSGHPESSAEDGAAAGSTADGASAGGGASEGDLSDQEASAVDASAEEASDEDFSDEDLADEGFSDEDLSDDGLSDGGLSDEDFSDEGFSNQGLGEDNPPDEASTRDAALTARSRELPEDSDLDALSAQLLRSLGLADMDLSALLHPLAPAEEGRDGPARPEGLAAPSSQPGEESTVVLGFTAGELRGDGEAPVQGLLPHDPLQLLQWLDGTERALGRRLRHLSHAINSELLRSRISTNLLPPNLLEAVIRGQVETQPAPPNLVRLQLPFGLGPGAPPLQTQAVLLRVVDLEMEEARLRTCRRRLQQHRQELRRMAQQYRRLQRRLEAREAERLWSQDIRRSRSQPD